MIILENTVINCQKG